MIPRKRSRPRQPGLAAKIRGVAETAKYTTPKRIGKREKPRRNGISAQMATGKAKPAKHRNSYARREKWSDYMAFIAQQKCVVCGRWPVDVAHVGELGKGMSNKCDNRQTLPLCHVEHHQEGPLAIHKIDGGPAAFWLRHGLNRDALIARFNAEYAAIDNSFEPLVRA